MMCMKSLDDQFLKAVSEKEKELAKVEKDLKELKTLAIQGKKFPMIWTQPVHIKNAQSTLEAAKILCAFRDRVNLKRYDSIDEVEMTNQRLWRTTQPYHVSANSSSSSKFRGYLSKLKTDGFLSYSSSNECWRLTPKAISKLMDLK